ELESALGETRRVEDEHFDLCIEHDVRVIREAAERVHRHGDRREDLYAVSDVQHLGTIEGKRGDPATAPDAQTPQRLDEPARGVAHPADGQRGTAGELEERAPRRLAEDVDEKIRNVERTVKVVFGHLDLSAGLER